MSDSSSPPSPDDVPTVRLPGAADLAKELAKERVARELLAAGSSWNAESAGGWGKWTFPEPVELAAQLNGYEVDRILGRGGMGAVYYGRQYALDRAVAIKVLPLELSTDPDFAARFHREAKAMARLDHPNIVRVIEFGKTAAGLLYFTMDYVEGGDVKQLLKEIGPLPAPRASELMREVCAALECAHRSGTIHRDIKPANILLTAAGHAKVADFGLARIADESEFGATRPGDVMGTPEYMAPEQRMGATAGPASDVFSAGVLFYQMLTGRLPQGAWPLPSDVCRERGLKVDERMDPIVATALQDDPSRRFADAGMMRKAIEETMPAGYSDAQERRAAPSYWMMCLAALLLAGAWFLLPQMPGWRRVNDRLNAAAISLAAPADRTAEQRVVLLDISRIEPMDQSDATGSRSITPRDKLLALVRGIAAERPQAIAIDIDFSPSTSLPGKPYSPDDPVFFRALLRLRQETGVPVFLGVHRQDSAGRNGWLGGAEFASLAAGLGMHVDDDNMVERLPLELVTDNARGVLPSLSTALARAAGAADPANRPAATLMSRLSGPVETGSLSVTEYTPNFSSLDRLAWQRVSGTDPQDVPGLRERLRRNLVVLSDAESVRGDGDDTFTVPARPNLQVRGAYIHACGLVTLLSGAPARFTRTGRILAAFLFVGLLAGGFCVMDRRVRTRRILNHASSKRVGRWVVVGAVALLAFLFMRSWRVAWPDVFYLSAALLLLRPLAGALDAGVQRVFTPRRKRPYPAAST